MNSIIKTNVFFVGLLGLLLLGGGVEQTAYAQTVTIPTLEGTIGSPVDFAYTPDFFVVMDPTQTIGFGMQPYLTVGGTLLDVKCNGAGVLAVTQNPGWNTLSLNPSSGTATMNFGPTAGLNVEFIAFGDTISGSLNINQLPNNGDLGFYATTNFSSYLLNTPVTLSSTISPNLVSINTLDALTVWFGIVIPDWLANINLDINADATLGQTVSGNSISTSAGDIGASGQTLAVDISGTSYQLQDIQETWLDKADLSFGLGADLSAGLLWGALNVQLVNFGSVPLINWSTTYPLTSESTSIQFNLTSHNVTASSGSDGSISPSGTSSYSSGASQQFTATPNTGYTVGGWYVDGSLVQNGGATYTLSDIQNNHTISVTFPSVGSGPTALTGGASSIGTTSANLNGSVNPNGLTTTAYFEWGTSTSYGNNTWAPPGNCGRGTTKIGVGPFYIDGLNPNTTYHFQLVAINSAGTKYGGDQTFTTQIQGSAPTVLTGVASGIGTTSAFMNGSVNPNGWATTAYFEWGTSTAYGNTVPNPQFNEGSGNNKIGTSAELTGLSPNTTYHCQLVAVNSVGTTYGGDQTFTTTGLLPTLTTGAASGISATTAFMNGSVNPNGLTTTAYFEWGTNTAYGNTIPDPSFNTGNGNANIGVSVELTGLSPNTTYHYQLLGTNTVGLAYGGDQVFTTVGLPVPPVLGPILLLPNGAAQVTLTGSIGQSYIILASTNFVNWVTLTNGTLTSVTEQFVDFSATNFYCRFYRAALP
jgi:hypothetical protein